MCPFDDDYSDLKKQIKPQQKLTNEKSMFNVPENNFEEKVKEIEQNKQKYKQKISQAALNFKKIIEDKTLSENKSPISKEIDSQVLKELTDLASKINSDESEQEGMGSILLNTILLKFMLVYRDRFNSLEYKIQLLNNRIDEFPTLIEKRLDRLDARKLDNK